MNYNYVEKCSSYFGYGNINDIIVADSFEWDQFEDFDLDNLDKQVIKRINYHLDNKKLYFYKQRIYSYPLSFKDKLYGLWKDITLNYNLKCINSYEEQFNLNTYVLRHGTAEILNNDIITCLKLCRYNAGGTFIVCSSFKNSFSTYKNNFEVTDKTYRVDMVKIINSYCDRGDTVITLIDGNNGTTINFFYKAL